MRLIPLTAAALILFTCEPATAQNWREFTSQKDFFIVNFPGEPTVQDVTYPTEFGINLPGRVYSVEDGSNRYSITVVDYALGEQIHADRARNCQGYPDTCTNRWMNDLRGALDYAVSKYIQQKGKVTYYAFADWDRVEGRRVQLTNANESRTSSPSTCTGIASTFWMAPFLRVRRRRRCFSRILDSSTRRASGFAIGRCTRTCMRPLRARRPGAGCRVASDGGLATILELRLHAHGNARLRVLKLIRP